jgi:hypothetical protein
VSLAEVLPARNQSALPAALGEVAGLLEVLSAENLSSRFENFGMSGYVPLAGDVRTLWMGAFGLAVEEGVQRSTAEIIRALLLRVSLLPAEISVVRDRLTGQLSICEPLLEDLAARHWAREADVARNAQIEGGTVDAPTRSVKDIAGVADRRPSDADDSDIKDGIFVPYAGLVLVHAFLNTFLSRVGLVSDGVFIDEVARERGVHLLQYLGTTEAGPPEYELVMAKVLCAYPLEAPVTREFQPTAAEVEEADALLDACLGQWTVLQNTSREGLRENFLQRNGRLHLKEGRLRLEVERSSIDVLLDYLPWNLSLVKLPWMKEILFVNWR